LLTPTVAQIAKQKNEAGYQEQIAKHMFVGNIALINKKIAELNANK
jgi:hypothetical protein